MPWSHEVRGHDAGVVYEGEGELHDERISHLVPNYQTAVYSNLFSLVSLPLALSRRST